ncbi:angiogenic factor with G patch and FHA domains 1 isoform X2 [Fopius arisanus]|uniref:Angiogenic factor with G patch and FHA domains 1 isoform X2 n=1 Tax=Fopius arisanus TaxID=64838 RepID=A0A9R1TK35_9HYME|nr:PREDICTED: angiogenic factor with G patch and FHA domains 1 isoform X2 [Fopius arisanus]
MSDLCEDIENDEELLEHNFSKQCCEILEQYPEILEFISKLQEHVKKQRKKICKLKNKLIFQKKSEENTLAMSHEEKTTQTEGPESSASSNHWEINSEQSGSITDQVKQVAESALQQSGFVYEETSGLYYDYTSGYYYDASQGLYYDGNSGTYYYYDESTKSYKFHSQPTTVDKCEKRRAKVANKVSDEIHELIARVSSIQLKSYTRHISELAKTYPPCMRIIVKETNLQKLKAGSLFIVAYTGGSLGREGDHSVLIPDINISKHHAKFQYDESKKHYEIVDLGSRNGTILDGKRLSVAKQESEPFKISHGSMIRVGETKLLCHIHCGYETCGHCEPGLIQQSGNSEGYVIPKKTQHRSELKRLKNKFGVDKDNTNTASLVASGYKDRAQARRVCVGSSDHHVKTQQSSVETSIAKDNKGFKLLSKMGWSEGQSLGKDGDGRTEPVPLVNNTSKSGLGATNPVVEMDPNVEKKQALWRKTKERYDGIS